MPSHELKTWGTTDQSAWFLYTTTNSNLWQRFEETAILIEWIWKSVCNFLEGYKFRNLLLDFLYNKLFQKWVYC